MGTIHFSGYAPKYLVDIFALFPSSCRYHRFRNSKNAPNITNNEPDLANQCPFKRYHSYIGWTAATNITIYWIKRNILIQAIPKKRDNDSAFPKRNLCLNLVSPSEDGDLVYDFRFLTKKEYQQSDDNHFWFVVGNILKLTEAVDVNDYLLENDISSHGKEK